MISTTHSRDTSIEKTIMSTRPRQQTFAHGNVFLDGVELSCKALLVQPDLLTSHLQVAFPRGHQVALP